jgi:hypothetical protein
VIEQEPKFRLRAPAPANLGGNGEQPLAESAKSDVRHSHTVAETSKKGNVLRLTFRFMDRLDTFSLCGVVVRAEVVLDSRFLLVGPCSANPRSYDLRGFAFYEHDTKT